MSGSRIRPWRALANGVKRNCPHCGLGVLLDGWLSARDRCPTCGLVYERNHGDTWAFWVVGDRIPVAIAIVAIYFGLKPASAIGGILFLGALAALLIVTIPHRMGLVLALHYLSRQYWPDVDDPVPGPGKQNTRELTEDRPA